MRVFIKLSRLNNVMKSAMYLIEVVKLKSLKKDNTFVFRKIIIEDYTKIF